MTMSYFAIPGLKPDIPDIADTTVLQENMPLSLEDIEKVVIHYTGVEFERMHRKTRKSEVVFARHLVHYFGTKNTLLGLKKIGNYYDQDHTTVIHGRERILNDLWAKNNETCMAVESIENFLK